MSTPAGNGFSKRPPGKPGQRGQSLGAEPSELAPPLQSADLIDVVAERASLDIDPMLDDLDWELAGLTSVKARVHQITDFLLVDRIRYHYGLMPPGPRLHMCFTGGPGTGKSTVAFRMAEILKALGYLDRGQLVTIAGDELVGGSLGCTAPKTNNVLNRALGGVLFVNEAYTSTGQTTGATSAPWPSRSSSGSWTTSRRRS